MYRIKINMLFAEFCEYFGIDPSICGMVDGSPKPLKMVWTTEMVQELLGKEMSQPYRGFSLSLYLSNEYPDWWPHVFLGGHWTLRVMWGWFKLYLSLNRVGIEPRAKPTLRERGIWARIKAKAKPYRGTSLGVSINNQMGIALRCGPWVHRSPFGKASQ